MRECLNINVGLFLSKIMKTFSIKTFGCKVNQYESQKIREILIKKGFVPFEEKDTVIDERDKEYNINNYPDICIINTCCVTERAEKKSKQYINRIKRENKNIFLIVTGCSVNYKSEGFKEIDLVVPNEKKDAIGDILLDQFEIQNKLYKTKVNRRETNLITGFAGRTRAFVKIQDGCNQFCSYCLLPYIRGRSRSRDIDEVTSEVNGLAQEGFKEIVLTGIHLGDYYKDRKEGKGFSNLLRRLEMNSKLLRIRLSSLEPQDINDDLLKTICESRKICRHFHIPLQSGSNKILNKMNRSYTYEEYISLIEKVKSKIENVVFTTDLIVGFPGEEKEDFKESMRAVSEIGFTKVHIFPYSNRAGTKAADFQGKISQKEIKERVYELQEIAQETAYKVKKGFMGSLQEVLIENSGRYCNGYTSGYIPIRIAKSNYENEIIKVRVCGLEEQCLIGEAVESE